MSNSHLGLWKKITGRRLVEHEGWREESREKDVAKPRFGESFKNVAKSLHARVRNKRKRGKTRRILWRVVGFSIVKSASRYEGTKARQIFFWLASGVATFEDPNATLIVINEKKCTAKNSFLFSRACLAAFDGYSPGFSTPYREKSLSKFCWTRDFFRRVIKHEISIPCAPTIFSGITTYLLFQLILESLYQQRFERALVIRFFWNWKVLLCERLSRWRNFCKPLFFYFDFFILNHSRVLRSMRDGSLSKKQNFFFISEKI